MSANDPSSRPGIEASCTQCGGIEFVQGYIGDSGQGARGFARWFAGQLERGIFGGPKGQWGADVWIVEAVRCNNCGKLELFARERD